MDARLVVVGGKASRSEIKLKLPAVIGRKRESGVMIDHKSVSRQHCEVFLRDGHLYVKDCNSSNGTFINDRKIGESILNPGDSLRIGPLTFTAAYIPEPPVAPPGQNARDSGDALFSDSPAEDSDFGGFFESDAPSGAIPFASPSGGRSRHDALVETDDSEAFGWLGTESSGGLGGLPSDDALDAPPAAPTASREDDRTYTHDRARSFDGPDASDPLADSLPLEDSLPDEASPADAARGKAGLGEDFPSDPESPSAFEADLADNLEESPAAPSNDLDDLESLGSREPEERSVFASLESPSLELEPNLEESSQDFLGRFGADWKEQAAAGGLDEFQPSEAAPDEAAPGETPTGDVIPAPAAPIEEPSSHTNWADDKKTPAPSFETSERTINDLDPWAAPVAENPASPAPTVPISASAPNESSAPADDWSQTSLDPDAGDPLEGLDFAFDEIEQPSAEFAAIPEAPELAAAAPPPAETPSLLETPAASDPAAPPQWAPPGSEVPSEDPPSFDLSGDDAPILEVVDEDEELLELELIDDAPALEEGESNEWANESDVDEDLELEVIDESQADSLGDDASPFDEPKKG